MERRRSVSVSLGEMVDLALNSPDVGTVHFHVLYSLLHSLLSTIGISDVQAPYEAVPLVVHSPSPSPTTADDQRPYSAPQNEDVFGEEPQQQQPRRYSASSAPGGGGSPAHRRRRSSTDSVEVHLMLQRPTNADALSLYPTYGLPELVRKVEELELRLDRMSRLPSNDELFGILADLQQQDEDEDADAGVDAQAKAQEGGKQAGGRGIQTGGEAQAGGGSGGGGGGVREKEGGGKGAGGKGKQAKGVEHRGGGGGGRAGGGAMNYMWQNMQLARKLEAQTDGVEKLIGIVNSMTQSSQGLSEDFKHLKHQVDNLTRIISTEMEVPSFVTWTDLEQILQGVLMKPVTDAGPSPALSVHMKTIGHLHEDVYQLGEKVQVHEETLSKITPDVDSLMTEVKFTKCELSTLLKEKADVSLDPERLTFPLPTDSSLPKTSADAEPGCELLLYASLQSRIHSLETAVKELHESLKARPNDLFMSMSDIQISPSAKNLLRADSSATVIVPQDQQHLSYDEPPSGRPRHMSSDSTVSKQSNNPAPRRLSIVETQDINTRMGQLTKKCKEMIRRNRIRVEEVESKLSDLSDQVTKLRRTVSCDDAEENSCIRIIQRSIEQLQADVRKAREMELVMNSVIERISQTQNVQEIMVERMQNAERGLNYLKSEIEILDKNMELQELRDEKTINEAVDKMDKNVHHLHDSLVFLRKDVRCHLNKMAEDVAELRRFYDEFGDSGAGVRKPFKFQCLSCDRKLLISPSDLPPPASSPEATSAAQTGFQSFRSKQPYISYELENIRNRQNEFLLPRQLTNFQRSILERHMARLRMRDFRAYFMQCLNDLPEVKMAKSFGCRTAYEMDAQVPDVYAQLPRSCGGGSMGDHLVPPSGNLGNGKGAEYLDVFHLKSTPSGKRGEKLVPSTKHTGTGSNFRNPRESQSTFHARRNMSYVKKTTKCRPLSNADDAKRASDNDSVQEMPPTSPHDLMLQTPFE